MKGKEKCKALKEIRRQIAEKNDIPYVVSQCKHQGDCLGTCPKCEAELRYLEKELAIRQGLGKVVAVAGISVGVCASLTACASSTENPVSAPDSGYEELSGDVEVLDPNDSLPQTETPKEFQKDETSGGLIDEDSIDEVEEPTEEPEEETDTDMLTGDISDISVEDMDESPVNGL